VDTIDGAMTTAFVLSGGANLGPMQVGSITALLEAGVEPDLYVGSSVGALNAGFLASRPGVAGAKALWEAWIRLRRKDGFRFNPAGVLAGFLGTRDSLIDPRSFRALIANWVEFTLVEDAPTPLAVMVTDALSGDPVVLRAGTVVDVLAASAAIPGLLPPVQIGERWFIDGNLSASMPAPQALALGADEVYVITTTTAPRLRPPRGAVAVAMNSVSLLTARAGRAQLAEAEAAVRSSAGHVWVVPSPLPEAPGPFDFSRADELAQASYAGATRWLAERAAERPV
jgi:NTE family protein